MDLAEKNLIIHIGAPKTGSTAIQKFLFDHRERLAQMGYLYPEVSLRGLGHHDLAFLINGGYPEWAIPQDRPLESLLDDLDSQCKDYYGSVILSSEDFYLYPQPERLADILRHRGWLNLYRPKIIVYIRRQDEAQESWYNQTIKAQGYTHDIAQCMSQFQHLWDYAENLRLWSEAFGLENIIVRLYENKQWIGENLLKDFLSILKLSDQDFKLPKTMSNSRLSRDLIEFQKYVNKLPLTPKRKRALHKELIELSEVSAGKGLFDESHLLSIKQCQEVLRQYSKSNIEVARTYFGRDRLFTEEFRDSVSDPPREGLNIAKLSYIIGWLMTGLKEQQL